MKKSSVKKHNDRKLGKLEVRVGDGTMSGISHRDRERIVALKNLYSTDFTLGSGGQEEKCESILKLLGNGDIQVQDLRSMISKGGDQDNILSQMVSALDTSTDRIRPVPVEERVNGDEWREKLGHYHHERKIGKDKDRDQISFYNEKEEQTIYIYPKGVSKKWIHIVNIIEDEKRKVKGEFKASVEAECRAINSQKPNSRGLWEVAEMPDSENGADCGSPNFHAWIEKEDGTIVDYGCLNITKQVKTFNKRVRAAKRIKIGKVVYKEWSIKNQIKKYKWFNQSCRTLAGMRQYTQEEYIADEGIMEYLNEYLETSADIHFGCCWTKGIVHKFLYPNDKMKIGSCGFERIDKGARVDTWWCYGM